jgi:ApaG protein
MRLSSLAVYAFIASLSDYEYATAFVPSSSLGAPRFYAFGDLSRTTTGTVVAGVDDGGELLVSPLQRGNGVLLQAGAGFLGMDSNEDEDDDEEDSDVEDDEDEDEEDELSLSTTRFSSAKSPFTGTKLDPWDPNPLIKPRPSRYFKEPTEDVKVVPDDQLVQAMSQEERGENLTVMRQIKKNDLPDLRRRKDYAGWVEANNDLKRRFNKDPWFGVNERLQDAIQLGDDAQKIEALQDLAKRLGGPPPGITLSSKGYANHLEIYDVQISPTRASSMIERQIREERAARGRAMMQERKKNLEKQQRQYEEDMRNPGLREDKEAKERRERTMRRLLGEIEEDNKKKQERAKEILGKVPETPETRMKAMEQALKEARDEVKKIRRKQLGKAGAASGGADDDDDDDEELISRNRKSGADKAREAAAAEAAGGRPRLPGDPDVTRGERGSMKVESSSATVTGPLQVEVSSVYNKEQSDPPMRKHCFQYTIRITNNSDKDTIQLLGRRFEIQTVGSSMKDIVQGEGVTGRTPILKPGEVFEYTSTAPLSVRPIGTTEIAARMRGEYRYVVLAPGQSTASEDQIKAGGEAKAELGMFHFVFPEEQRVKPFKVEGDDDDEEDDDDDAEPAPKASSAVANKPASTPSATPASTLPGDADMKSGDIATKLNDSSETTTEKVRVQVSSSYRPERSDAALDKHCFAYNIRITNESNRSIQLVSRRFEIQTIGSANKDVVQGPGVTGRQPILKPGESFEYTSTAPLSVKPILDKTPVVARMQGEYNFVVLGDDGTTPMSSEPLKAKLGQFHFILPALV